MDPSHREIMDFILWALGATGGIVAFFLALWWRVEKNQSDRISSLHKANDHQHEIIHGKIDKVRDKTEEIWKHLVRKNGGREL